LAGFAPALRIALLTQGWQIGALIVARYVTVVVGVGLTGALVRRLPRVRLRRETARTAAETVLPLWRTNSVHLFTNYGADIVLGAFASAAMVGAYRGGARIAVTESNLVVQPLTVLTWSRPTRIEKTGTGPAALRDAWMANMAIARETDRMATTPAAGSSLFVSPAPRRCLCCCWHSPDSAPRRRPARTWQARC
jgi:hypothetical protein